MTSSVARAFSIRTNWSERAGVEPPSSSWTGRSTFELPSQYTFDILPNTRSARSPEPSRFEQIGARGLESNHHLPVGLDALPLNYPRNIRLTYYLIPDLRKSSGNVRKIFLGRSPAGNHTGEAAAHPYRAEEGSRQSTVRNPRPQRRGFRAAGFSPKHSGGFLRFVDSPAFRTRSPQSERGYRTWAAASGVA